MTHRTTCRRLTTLRHSDVLCTTEWLASILARESPSFVPYACIEYAWHYGRLAQHNRLHACMGMTQAGRDGDVLQWDVRARVLPLQATKAHASVVGVMEERSHTVAR